MSQNCTAALSAALDRLFSRTAHGIRPGLDIISALLAELGHPEQKIPCIHVAGTNGKGSVCAMLHSVLLAAGYRSACYTSPHLLRFHERFQMGSEPVGDDDLAQWLDRVEETAATLTERDGLRPATFFECATAMAYGLFQQHRVEWAILETGLGGRWDATNTGRTALSVITRIDMDHMNFLGDRLVDIAHEKAGIIKPCIPVVSGPQHPEVAEVLEQTARDQKAPMIWADQVARLDRVQQHWEGQKIRIDTDQRSCGTCLLPLTGKHQLENAAIAVAALETMEAIGYIQLNEEAIREGLSATRWPARCQCIADDPVTIVDVAHNPDGARALIHALNELGGKKIPVGFVTGFLADKDVSGCIRALAPRASHFWAVGIHNHRAMPAPQLAELIASTGRPVVVADLGEALDAARAWAKANGGLVCIAGSLYLAGEVLEILERSGSLPTIDDSIVSGKRLGGSPRPTHSKHTQGR